VELESLWKLNQTQTIEWFAGQWVQQDCYLETQRISRRKRFNHCQRRISTVVSAEGDQSIRVHLCQTGPLRWSGVLHDSIAANVFAKPQSDTKDINRDVARRQRYSLLWKPFFGGVQSSRTEKQVAEVDKHKARKDRYCLNRTNLVAWKIHRRCLFCIC